jgi:hypothetical protein
MDIRETIENLMYELGMAIDEVNTMRDIHNTDTLQPADHWDKETLHDAQLALRDFIEERATPITDRIETHHKGNRGAFAKLQGVGLTQVIRWIKLDCVVINGEVWRRVAKNKVKSK